MDRHYRASPNTDVLSAPLDEFTAVFHRASGITHLLASPAPEILAALGEVGTSIDALMARLANDYDLADGASLATRLDELVATGLVVAS